MALILIAKLRVIHHLKENFSEIPMSCQPIVKDAIAGCYGNMKELDMLFLDANLSMKIDED